MIGKLINTIKFFKNIANWHYSDDFQYFSKMKTMKTVFLFMQISFKCYITIQDWIISEHML